MAEQNIEKILEKYNEDIKRQIGVLGEDFDGKVELIGEQYETIIGKLDNHETRLDQIDQRFDNIEVRLTSINGTLDTMKLDLEFIKNELKQKVNRDEFAALEKRLSMLEIKLNQTS